MLAFSVEIKTNVGQEIKKVAFLDLITLNKTLKIFFLAYCYLTLYNVA
jgi:hypothetical protein